MYWETIQVLGTIIWYGFFGFNPELNSWPDDPLHPKMSCWPVEREDCLTKIKDDKEIQTSCGKKMEQFAEVERNGTLGIEHGTNANWIDGPWTAGLFYK